VLGAQFAAFSAVGAFVLFKERLRRIQVVGVVAILVGVGILALLSS
jgi:multidrug transporter EmrE-like cation transporter